VGGNPAKAIRKRFSEQEIALLLEMQWWDWPLDDIKGAMPFLCSSDIAGLYRAWKNSSA
jgi:chloramphenicol O-acetyltransferase type B